jgi:hypothetical protein
VSRYLLLDAFPGVLYILKLFLSDSQIFFNSSNTLSIILIFPFYNILGTASSRAVTFVTMASITSASVLSEAEFGCEHLAAILTQSGNTAEQFKSSFLKTHNALAPRPLPLFPKPLTVDDLPKQKGGLRTASLLRPKYTCLTCSEVCAPADRPAHTKETGHHFCKSI